MIFINFSENVYVGISFEKCEKIGVTILVKKW